MSDGRSVAPPSPGAHAASPEIRRLVAAALAGERYRSGAVPAIARDLRAAPPRELARALNAAHIAPLFLHAFGSLLPRGPLRAQLRAAHRGQRLHSARLRTQFARVRRALNGIASVPVVLKGPALWGWIYPSCVLRQTRDLDLLIADPDDLRRAVHALRAIGFAGDDGALDRALGSRDHYELPPLVRTVRVSAAPNDARALDRLRRSYPELAHFSPRADGGYEMTVEVELHRGVFLYRDGSLPLLEPALLAPHPLLPGYARLSLPAQLVHLATKFGLDTEGADGAPPQAQSLKLLADVVRLVERATAEELGESVRLAGEWRCGRYLGATLATAAPLLPEVDFTGPTFPPYDLDALVDLAGTPPQSAV